MDPRDYLIPGSRSPALSFVYSAGWLPLMGSSPSGALIYLLGKELTTHFESSFVALYRILHELLQEWCTLLYNFSGGWSPDHFHDIVQDLVHWSNSARKSGCSSSIVAPQVWAASAKCALPPSTICTLPNFWWRPFPDGGRIPMACCLPLACSFLRDFFWSLLKICCQHHGLKGISCLQSELRNFPILRCRHNIPLTTDIISRNPTTLSGPFHWLSPSLQEALLVHVGRE